jgi:hypothetical protein
MERWMGRMAAVGLLMGGTLTLGGCFYQPREEQDTRPHTPVQERYRPPPSEAADPLGSGPAEGLQRFPATPPTTARDENPTWRGHVPRENQLRWIPNRPSPEEPYAFIEQALPPPSETGLGGAGMDESSPRR